MTRSMTGFGKATRDFGGGQISVELSAVNHRYMDCSLKLPNGWSALEPVIKQTAREHVSRGKLWVTVSRKQMQTAPHTVQFDRQVAQQYIHAAKDLAQLLGVSQTLSVDVLAQLDGVFYCEEPEENLAEIESVVLEALHEALDRLNAMRGAEGGILANEIGHRVALMREALATVELRLPELCALYEERLRQRLAELVADTALTEQHVAIEVAIMADKGDVTEEVVRLKAHLDHLTEVLAAAEPVGRKLDFLAQEVQREVNTLGVKVRDSDVSKEVLRMKSELEKIREQVQNIE